MDGIPAHGHVKNFNVPKGPEMHALNMTRTLFGSIDALKALVTQFMTALNIPFDPK
jgi:hypothetical protein